MILDLQFRLKSDPRYIQFLRENSNWYKILNRNPLMFTKFEDSVKEVYKLRASDKFLKALNTLEIVQNIVSSFK